MYQPEARKYQLFPTSSSAAKQPEPEPMAAGLGQPTDEAEKTESTDKCNGLRLRIKEHNLNRRRKVSVPELGPMTTVHEVAMDSRKLAPYVPIVLGRFPDGKQLLYRVALLCMSVRPARPSTHGGNPLLPLVLFLTAARLWNRTRRLSRPNPATCVRNSRFRPRASRLS